MFLFDTFHIDGQNNVDYKLNGYKTINWQVNHSDIDISSFDEYYKIYQWTYDGGNIVDKIGLTRNILSLNFEKEKGYVVAIVDNTNKGVDAQYWTDDFLHVKQRKDEYYNTQNVLSLCKNFVKNELPQQFEISKADQVDFLNKSVKFFKENDNFNLNEFANEVIGQPDIIESFNQYKSSFQQDYDIEISDSFTISESAVKKQVRSLKSVIKLDKNFHIYIHGDRELLKQGQDKKGKYYKVYYQEES